MKSKTSKVTIVENGPYLVSGGLPLAREIIGANGAGDSIRWQHDKEFPQEEEYALCRCGHSKNKPFCDGSHERVGVDGTETASREPYIKQAKVLEGPSHSLSDVYSLCAVARFCDTHGTVWNLVNQTNDTQAREHFLQEVCHCPSGRLVAFDNQSGEPIEPEFEPSIGLIEDPVKNCSGPIWLRGGVQVVGADGFEYEVRNRVTLCRCGVSRNKPFCDGSHITIKFNGS